MRTNLLISLALGLLSSTASPQMPGSSRDESHTAGGNARRRHPRVPSHVIPFPFLRQSVGFPVIMPQKTEFNEMLALSADLMPAQFSALKSKTSAIQLTYGYKKGGIACVYQMPKQPGVSGLSIFQQLIKGGPFKDREYFEGWSIKEVPDAKLFIAVSGTTPAVRDALIRALKK